MPYFGFKHTRQGSEKKRSFTFPKEIPLKHIAVAICKDAQSRLDCFGKFNVIDDGIVKAEFTHQGADQLFETVRDWCEKITIIDNIDIDMDVAECIGSKIPDASICCYQWMNDDDDEEEIQTGAIIYGDKPKQFKQKFEQLSEKFANEWAKRKTVIKTASFAIARFLTSMTEEKHQDDNTFIYAIPPADEEQDKNAKYRSNIVIFGDDQNTYMNTYNKLFNKYVFQDTPEVLACILMKKTHTTMDHREITFVPNGLQTLIYPCSDDEEKNTRFYKELFRLRSNCDQLEVKTTLTDNTDLRTMCREIDMDNVFYFVQNGKIFLHGLREDVSPFKKVLEKRLRSAESIASQARLASH